jgi:hypothetical protein
LPMVQAQGERVAREDCAEHQRCVPCYDPLTGAFTAACSLAGDKPAQPPRTFGDCCNDQGRCLPAALLAPAQQRGLGRDVCAAASELCVPEPFLNDPQFVPKTCRVAAFGGEGRCLPACLLARDARRGLLAADGCEAFELCAPCFDPFTGQATGSCAQGADPGPAQPALVFGTCCGSAGRCLPMASVPVGQRSLLGRESCADTATLCVPEVLVSEPDFTPAPCRTAAWGAEGRCLWACLPSVAERSAVLSRDGCEPEQLCVPCYDPLDGRPSGACDIAGDAPAAAPLLAAYCCEERGRCVPESLLPADSAARFGHAGCTADTTRCVAPASLLAATPSVPRSCRDARTMAEGRCLPDCLPDVAARAASLSQADCARAERCVPCFDPLSGDATGACSAPGDPGPSGPKRVFDPCCPGADAPIGACVPESALPAGLPSLPVQTCPSASVCAPRALISDPNAALPRCQGSLTGAGLCIARCFLGDDATLYLLSQASCSADELCVPCGTLGSGLAGC